MLTDEELRAIANRVEKATSGPWFADGTDVLITAAAAEESHGGDGWEKDERYLLVTCEDRYGWADDMRFIAAAREDVVRLLADLRRYRDWCRCLVKCCSGEGDVIALAEEVRRALEDKAC